MIIDFHSHILPGIDDGAKNWDEFLEIAQLAAAAGITHMVCTPHFIYKEVEFKPENYYRLLSKAVYKLKEQDLKISLISGSEVFYDPELLPCLKEGRILTINNGNKYLMVEFARLDIPNNVESIITILKNQGITPVIAHPERNLAFSDEPELLIELIKRGAVSQLNVGSIAGEYGEKIRKTAELFLKSRMIHLLGSDVHSPKNAFRNFNLGMEVIEGLVGSERIIELKEVNPLKIIEGVLLEPYSIELKYKNKLSKRRKDFYGTS
ncbi:MAG: hypothetical protein VR72_04080 [Clostridiaceae bacterium BRH_c20a]|nr:MAG: hypothetical protein VR72_04080 [Clostridiaceae bacterium BRH_c20a]